MMTGVMRRYRRVVFSVLIVGAFFVSAFPLSRYFTPPAGELPPPYQEALQRSLDEKNAAALALFAGATAASVAVSLLPGDIGNAVSGKLADVAGLFMLVVGTITLEKVVLSISGVLSFRIILPAALALLLLHVWTRALFLRAAALKCALLGFALLAAVPASLLLSNLVEENFLYTGVNRQTPAEAVDAVEKTASGIEEVNSQIGAQARREEAPARKWYDLPGKLADAVQDASDWVNQKAHSALKNGEEALKTLMNALVNMALTVCIIPLLTIVLFALFVKSITPGVETGNGAGC